MVPAVGPLIEAHCNTLGNTILASTAHQIVGSYVDTLSISTGAISSVHSVPHRKRKIWPTYVSKRYECCPLLALLHLSD